MRPAGVVRGIVRVWGVRVSDPAGRRLPRLEIQVGHLEGTQVSFWSVRFGVSCRLPISARRQVAFAVIVIGAAPSAWPRGGLIVRAGPKRPPKFPYFSGRVYTPPEAKVIREGGLLTQAMPYESVFDPRFLN